MCIRVIASWQFNFMAEGLLRTLGPQMTWVFHVGKTPQQIADFEKPAWCVREIVIDEQLKYGELLDQILVRRKWPELLEARGVTFIEHDVLFTGKTTSWRKFEDRLCAGIVANHALCARSHITGGHYQWDISPAFSVKSDFHWPDTWAARVVDGCFRDTGMALTRTLEERGQWDKVDIFDWPIELLHWGSTYTKMTAGDPRCASVTKHYEHLADSGHWVIGPADADRLPDFPLLAAGVRAMAVRKALA